jgi:hypothetical protein
MLRVAGRILVGGFIGGLLAFISGMVFFFVILPCISNVHFGVCIECGAAILLLTLVGAIVGVMVALRWPNWPSWLAWSDLSPLIGFGPVDTTPRSTPPLDIGSLPSYPR